MDTQSNELILRRIAIAFEFRDWDWLTAEQDQKLREMTVVELRSLFDQIDVAASRLRAIAIIDAAVENRKTPEL